MNGDTLASDSPFKSKINTAVANWMGSFTKAYCTTESFSVSNVDIGTATDSWWNSHASSIFTVAITIPTDTNGRQIFNATDAKYSTRKIDYANIFVGSHSGDDLDSTELLQTLVHEMGHVYGMGHTLRTDSIMYPYVSHVTKLTQYDTDVMNSFYK